MKIHYFQRYHEIENVATANTMLLLSRLYSYSSDKFFRFLKSEFFSDSFEPELVFTLQEKSVSSIPDATITQEGFKIVVETKLSDWFYETDFKKITPRAPMGTRIFDLSVILGREQLPDTGEIAELLKERTWT